MELITISGVLAGRSILLHRTASMFMIPRAPVKTCCFWSSFDLSLVSAIMSKTIGRAHARACKDKEKRYCFLLLSCFGTAAKAMRFLGTEKDDLIEFKIRSFCSPSIGLEYIVIVALFET